MYKTGTFTERLADKIYEKLDLPKRDISLVTKTWKDPDGDEHHVCFYEKEELLAPYEGMFIAGPSYKAYLRGLEAIGKSVGIAVADPFEVYSIIRLVTNKDQAVNYFYSLIYRS